MPAAEGLRERGGDHEHPGEQGRGRGAPAAAEPGPDHRDELSDRSGVGQFGECAGGAVGALGLAGQRAQQASCGGVAGGEGTADEQGVEDGPGRGHRGQYRDHRPALADRQHDHPAQPDGPADAVEPVGERCRGARIGHRVVVGLVERKVDDVPTGLEHHSAEGERPYVVAAAGGAEREARVVRVLLGPVEGRVQPGTHRRVLQRVAGELPVGAVQDEGEEEEQPGGDVAAAGAGRRAAGRDQRGQQGGGGDLVRREAAAGAPAGDVAGVRADEERGEEAVVGLHGAAQPHRLVVDRVTGAVCRRALRLVDRHGRDQRAQLGALHGGAPGVHGGGETAGQGAVGDRHGGRARGDARAPGLGRGVQGRGERGARLRLRGERAGHGGRGEAGSVSPSRRAWTWPTKRGSTSATRRSAGTAESSRAASAASAATCTSKPSDRRSSVSDDPGTSAPVRMAVDRRTHSLVLTGSARGKVARMRAGGTSAEAIG